MNVCAYCQQSPPSNSEHVFPEGLGCGAYYLDCVCDDCNNFFSRLESELMLRSPINLPRAAVGLSGKDLASRRHVLQGGFHLYPELSTGIVFEVGTTLAPGGSQPYLRPQILAWENSYLMVATTEGEWEIFEAEIGAWFRSGMAVVTLPPSRRCDPYEGYASQDHGLTWTKMKWTKCPKVFLRVIDNGTFKDPITPRLTIDNHGRLHCRVADESALLGFLTDLCPRIAKGESFSGSGIPAAPTFDMVQISYSMDVDKVLRAAGKIMVNGLLHIYPTVRVEAWLRIWADYVLNGTGTLVGWAKAEPSIDSAPGFHQLIFNFLQNETRCRLVLFDHVAFTAKFPKITRNTPDELKVIIVDYQTGELDILADAAYLIWKSRFSSKPL